MGRRSESTDGGESIGEVGRGEARLARRLLFGLLSLLGAAEVLMSGGREVILDPYVADSGTVGGGRTSLSVSGCEVDEENDPILFRISVGPLVDACRSASASSRVRVRGLGPPW